MANTLTAFLLGVCIFGSLALTAAFPVLAQRAATKATCEAQSNRGWSPAESMAKGQITRLRPSLFGDGC